MADQVVLDILVEIDKSLKSLTEFEKKSAKIFGEVEKDSSKSLQSIDKKSGSMVKSVASGFTFLKGVAIAATAYFAGKELINGMNSAIKAAAEQEQAFANLATALKNSGNFSQDAVEHFGKLSAELEKTSVFSDEVILNQIALAQQFGITNDQTEKLIKAAVNLSAATGQDLNTSVEQLGKTLSGNVGLLARSNKELQGISEQALKTGAAIDILGKKYEGAAAGQLNTFSGATTGLSHAFDNFLESIGNVIVKNPAIVGAIRALSDVVEVLTGFMEANQKPISEMIASMIIMGLKTIPVLIDGIKFLGNAFLFLREIGLRFALALTSVYSAMLEIKAVRSVFKFFFEYFKEQILISISLLSGLLEAFALIPGAGKFIDPIVKKIDGLGNAIAEVSGDDALGGLTKGIDDFGVTLAKSLDQSDDLFTKFNDQATKAKTFTEGLVESVKNFGSASTSAFTGGGGAAAQSLADSTEKKPEKADKEAKKAAEKAGETVGQQIYGYITAAGTFMSDTLSGRFLKEIQGSVELLGGFASSFADVLKSLPDVISSFIKSIPKVVDGIVKAAPKLFQKIADFLPKLASVLGDAFLKIADVIADNAPKLAGAILDAITKLVDAAPKIIDKLVSALPKLLRAILQKLPALIAAIARAIPQIVRSVAMAIPELVVVIAEEMPTIVTALIEGIITAIPAIIFALVDAFILKGGLVKIAIALVKMMPEIAIALVMGIANGLKNILPGIFGNLGKVFSSGIKLPKLDIPKINLPKFEIPEKVKDVLTGKAFVDAIKAAFKKIIDSIKNALKLDFGGGGGGGGGGVLGGLGLATGGYIPPGFPNDTFPARLTSGEDVLRPGISDRMEGFLDNFESGGGSGGGKLDVRALAQALAQIINSRPMEVKVSVGEQEFATAMLNARRRGFRT